MVSSTWHSTRIGRRHLCVAIVALITGLGLMGAGAGQAKASTALGCYFHTSAPYVASNGWIYTKLQVRCSQTRYLNWHARITKDRFGPDLTAGASDGRSLFEAGVLYTWSLYNNSARCPGSGTYFGKLSIQSSYFSTAYVDRSFNTQLSHC